MTNRIAFAVALCFAIKAFSAQIPHYELEMSSLDYEVALRESAELGTDQNRDPKLQLIMDAGKKNLDWLKAINSSRDGEHKLSFSSAATQRAIPITDPNIYNRDIIIESFSRLIPELPQELKDVVLGSAPLTTELTLPEEVYLDYSRKVDRSYQNAARWALMAPYLAELKLSAVNDVRGYYFLTHVEGLKELLQNWFFIRQQAKKDFTEDLIQICVNNNSPRKKCKKELESTIKGHGVYDFYLHYIEGAKTHYDSYFNLKTPRSDVIWSHNPEEMHVPFRPTESESVQIFLKDNIQDEWKWNDWQLLLDFSPTGATHIVFEPGVTAHVNGIAGSTITMDANSPLTEYNFRWTIRHEFGHVLGFPDCYLEFYDEPSHAIMNYQLDITNLMCSRRGHFQELHFNELKKYYGRFVPNQ